MVCSCVLPSESLFAANNILFMRNSNHALVVALVLCEMADRDDFPKLSESDLNKQTNSVIK